MKKVLYGEAFSIQGWYRYREIGQVVAINSWSFADICMLSSPMENLRSQIIDQDEINRLGQVLSLLHSSRQSRLLSLSCDIVSVVGASILFLNSVIATSIPKLQQTCEDAGSAKNGK